MRINGTTGKTKRTPLVKDRLMQAGGIRNYQKNYHMLIDSSGDGILVIDSKGALRYANPTARDLLGLDRTAPQALPLCLPIDIDGMVEMEIARENAPPAMVEKRTKHVEWEGMSARFVTLHDITAPKLAFEQLDRARSSAPSQRRISFTCFTRAASPALSD
jgi:hypothetical protein